MSGYIFSSKQPKTISVPSVVADSFLPIASGVQIKVILCLIRFEGMPLSNEDIARQCNIAVDDVKPSIDFWVKQGVLRRSGSQLTLAGNAGTGQPYTIPKYNPESILEVRDNDEKFAELLDEIQRILGKPVTPNDISIIFGMYDYLGFSADLILLLINFCISNGKSSFRYMERVALDWHDREIDSFEKAEAFIKVMEKSKSMERAVATYFGIEGRALSKKEKEYINAWVNELNMAIELIKEAYEVCIDKKGKLSFAYINGILNDWNKKGYKTAAQVREQPRQDSQKSYDISEIEREILRRMEEE